MDQWIDGELKRQLRGVAAPDSLWEGIQKRRAEGSPKRFWGGWGLAVPVFATALVLLSAGLLSGVRQLPAARQEVPAMVWVGAREAPVECQVCHTDALRRL